MINKTRHDNSANLTVFFVGERVMVRDPAKVLKAAHAHFEFRAIIIKVIEKNGIPYYRLKWEETGGPLVRDKEWMVEENLYQ
jgi:hypothetical protein